MCSLHTPYICPRMIEFMNLVGEQISIDQNSKWFLVKENRKSNLCIQTMKCEIALWMRYVKMINWHLINSFFVLLFRV